MAQSQRIVVIASIAGFFFVALVGVLGLKLWREEAKDAQTATKSKGTQVVPVKALPLTRGPIEEILSFSGSCEPESRFELSSQLDGVLVKLNKQVGEWVEKGEVVASLDSDLAQQLLLEAKASYAVAVARWKETQNEAQLAQKNAQRVAQLKAKEVVSEADFDKVESARLAAESAIAVAEAEMQLAQAKVHSAEMNLNYCDIQAHWNEGDSVRMVSKRWVDEGQRLQQGQPLLTLMDQSILKIVFYVTESQYAKLQVDQKARVTCDAWPEKFFEATLCRIDPVFSTTSRQARVECYVDNQQGFLKPGMFVRLRMVIQRIESACLVSKEALVRRSGFDVIYLIAPSQNTVRQVQVSVGLEQGDQVQLLNDQLQGEAVVLGQHLLKDGSEVKIVTGFKD
jgi:RND family efflux transporter MFP subunit